MIGVDQYKTRVKTHDYVSGTVTLDLSVAAMHKIIPNGDVTIQFANEYGAGNLVGIFFEHPDDYYPDVNITWPNSFDWSEGDSVTLLGNSDAKEVLAETLDGGASWRAKLSSKVEVASAVPRSSVSRPADDRNGTTSGSRGVVINSDVEWPAIDGKISSQTSGATRARVIKTSDGTVKGTTDISNLSSGDIFRIENLSLQPNTDYSIVLDASGNSWTDGYLGNSPNFPFTSSDGKLEIVAKSSGGTSTDKQSIDAISEVGNLK